MVKFDVWTVGPILERCSLAGVDDDGVGIGGTLVDSNMKGVALGVGAEVGTGTAVGHVGAVDCQDWTRAGDSTTEALDAVYRELVSDVARGMATGGDGQGLGVKAE